MTRRPSSPSASASGDVEICDGVAVEETKIGANCKAPRAAIDKPGVPIIPVGNAVEADGIADTDVVLNVGIGTNNVGA